MIKLSVYNTEGKQEGETLASKDIFGVKFNHRLVSQVIFSQMANRRQVLADTKDRAEVSGGGRKPWRQKGTGRARHGSNRSPIWRHGGIVFGPNKDVIYKKEIPSKIKRLALFMVLSQKANENAMLVVEGLKSENKKTKEIAAIFSKFPSKDSTVLFILPEMDRNLILASRNIKNITPIQAKDLNALDVLSAKYIILSKESIKTIENTFSEKKEPAVLPVSKEKKVTKARIVKKVKGKSKSPKKPAK